MIYYRNTLFGSGPKLTAVHSTAGFYISTMAQVYPEDRGTNYAIRQGRKIGKEVSESIGLANKSISH
jgi:hypothetical protein